MNTLPFAAPRWHKVLRDVWGNKVRTLLVVLAIAVGVFAFGSVFITQEVLLRDMNQGYQSIRPAHATLNISPFGEDAVQAVRGMRGVADAEGRTAVPVKLQVAPGEWINLDVYVLSDYENIRINRITPEQGSWPPARRELLLERSSVALARAQIGDTILIELPDGEQKEILFAGTIHDINAIPASLFPQGTGYISLETLEWLGQPHDFTQLNVVLADPDPTLQEVEAVSADVTARLERSGYTVYSATIPEPGKHWASDVTRAFTVILSGIGVFSLILSGFLVVNTISSIIAQQKRQIGMMKAVGARGGQVMGVYLVTVAVFGLLGLLVAIPVGMWFAWASTQAVALFLNIDIVSFHLPVWVLLLQLFTSLAVPLIAAFFPIWAGTHITVREAVSDYGIGMAKKVGLIDRLLSGVRGLPRPTLLSLRNTFRRKGRLYLTLSTLTLAGAIFIAILNVRSALMLELDKALALFGYDIQVGLGDLYNVRQLEREARRVEGVESLEGWTLAQVQPIRADGTEGSTIMLFGTPPDTDFIHPTMLEGRWLEPGDQNAIVISLDLLNDEPGLAVGDEIRLVMDDHKRDWVIVGVMDSTGQGAGQVYAYTDFSYLSRLQGAPGSSGVLMVGTSQHDAQFQSRVARQLEERLKHAGISVAGTYTLAQIYGANVSQFDFLIGFMLVMAVLLAVVGGLGLTGTMSLNVLERTREIGVMRAIGANTISVGLIVLVEGLTIGWMSWLLGVLLAFPMSHGFGAAVGMAFFERPLLFAFTPTGLLAWFVIATLLSALASMLPALNASHLTVHDALAYE